jgi:hypothetical protein
VKWTADCKSPQKKRIRQLTAIVCLLNAGSSFLYMQYNRSTCLNRRCKRRPPEQAAFRRTNRCTMNIHTATVSAHPTVLQQFCTNQYKHTNCTPTGSRQNLAGASCEHTVITNGICIVCCTDQQMHNIIYIQYCLNMYVYVCIYPIYIYIYKQCCTHRKPLRCSHQTGLQETPT